MTAFADANRFFRHVKPYMKSHNMKMQKGWYANGFVAYQPFLIQSSDPGNLLDGVQPLLLGGLLGFELGLLLRIGFGCDLRVKLGELCVELLLERRTCGRRLPDRTASRRHPRWP